jgi:undecaprenyl diphosphate synthase
VRRVVAAAPALGVHILTLQGLSCDEPRTAEAARPVLAGIGAFLDVESPALLRAGVRVTVFGERDRIPADVRRVIEVAERATAGEIGLHLRIAIDCSGRGAILATLLGGIAGHALLAREPSGRLGPDVDLLIRTGGERRLADFLLWECAHAELRFVDTPWPEFGERELAAAVAELHGRERDPGVPPQASQASCGDRPPPPGAGAATPPASGMLP